MNDQPAAAPRHWWTSMTRPPRRWWALGVVIVVVAGLAAAAYAVVGGGVERGEPEDCEFNAFDAPIQIMAMSPSGKYIVGTSRDLESDATFSVWHDGEYTEVNAGGHPTLLDVNDSGDVLGYADSIIWRYTDGRLQYLKAPDGSSEVTAAAIGADGTVVGGTSDEPARPVKWSPGSVTATELDLDGHDHGTAVDIAADGTIVGTVGDGDTATDAWRWDADGKGREFFGSKTLPGLPRVEVAGDSEAVSVTGDWVRFTVGGGLGWYRVNLADPDNPRKLKMRSALLDEYGREYGSKKDDLAVYDTKITKLPGLTAPPTPAEDAPDEEYNEILAVSADGARIAGRTWDDKDVLWICDGSKLPKTVKASATDATTDGPSKDPKACRVKELTTLEGKDYATETHVSPDGAYAAIGIAYFTEDKSDSFGLWHDGEYTEVDGVPALGSVDVYGVNSSGMVIGESSATGDDDRSTNWRYQDGKVQTLEMPAGASSVRVNAIGEDGTVVGTFQDLESHSGPLLWKPGRSTPTKLDDGGYGQGHASDVSESGIIVGSRPEKEDYAEKAWLWDAHGEATQLPDVGTDDSDYSAATAIAGDWVLLTTQDNGPYTFYRYNLKDEGEPERVKLTEANDIDAKGRVYGTNGSSLTVYDGTFHEQPKLDDSGEDPAMDDQINSTSTDGSVFAGHSADEPALWSCG